MKVKILGFGIVKDIFQSPSVDIELGEPQTSSQLRELLYTQYPELGRLKTFMIAINNVYEEKNQQINAFDEIAIIPPVSGG